MAQTVGVIISETEPMVGSLLWIKPSTGELFEPSVGGWQEAQTDLKQLPAIVTLLNNGVTGSKTVGGHKFTFNHGVLVGFEVV